MENTTLPTILKYLDDPYIFTGTAIVVKCAKWEEKDALITDQTIFYPQGGGSPYDQGMIKGEKGIFQVDQVRFADGLVYHIGGFVSGTFIPGDKVNLEIDEKRRRLNCKLQTAGHLVDEAMRNIGYGYLIPTKGYHFPDGPNVEYEGTLPPEKIEKMKKKLEVELNKMIQTGFEVKSLFVTKDEMPKYCHFMTKNIPEGKPLRVVIVWGEKGIGCGANHVKNIKDIGPITIRKIKVKGNAIKVGYDIKQ
jgi:Ser-tRNA(Ala) deacylase AlaX